MTTFLICVTENAQCAIFPAMKILRRSRFDQQARKTSAARYYWPTREPYFDGLIDSTGKFRSRRVGSSASDREMRACRDGRDRDAKSAFSPEEKIRANGARGIRARADVGDDAHEADAARGRRRDPPEVGRAALRQPATPNRCVSRRNRRLPGEQRPVHFFRAEARRRDARRAAVRRRATRSRAADALRARVAESSATSSAPARGDAREHTPIAASSCRVARGKISSLRENLISTRENLMRRVSLVNECASPFVSSFSLILFLSRILYRSR